MIMTTNEVHEMFLNYPKKQKHEEKETLLPIDIDVNNAQDDKEKLAELQTYADEKDLLLPTHLNKKFDAKQSSEADDEEEPLMPPTINTY
jgi:hypothetical protein